MNPIFKRTDFVLCDVPVPKGYPQSQTHSGVALIDDSTLIMTTSPYPSITNGKIIRYLKATIRKLTNGWLCQLIPGDHYENPCIYIAESETSFKLLQNRPLMECPEANSALSAFNSDPDLFIEGDNIYVTNRPVYRYQVGNKVEYRIRLYLIRGLYENNSYKLLSKELVSESEIAFGSQSLTKCCDSYIFAYISSGAYNDGESFDGIYLNKSINLNNNLFNYSDAKKICVETSMLPWHFSLFTYHDKLYSIVACVEQGRDHFCWQMLGEFNSDYTKMHIYKTPLTDFNSYRASAYVSKDGIFYLYNTTVHEKIAKSKSVDGREIVLASMPFEALLIKMKSRE